MQPTVKLETFRHPSDVIRILSPPARTVTFRGVLQAAFFAYSRHVVTPGAMKGVAAPHQTTAQGASIAPYYAPTAAGTSLPRTTKRILYASRSATHYYPIQFQKTRVT